MGRITLVRNYLSVPVPAENLRTSDRMITISTLLRIALRMASFLPLVLSSSMLPHSSFSPVHFSVRTHAAKSFTGNLKRRREDVNNSINLVPGTAARQCEDGASPEDAQLNMCSQSERSLTKQLGDIALGVLAATSVIGWDWNLQGTAFADEQLPPDGSAVVTPYAKSADRMKLGLLKGRIQACPLDINPNCVSTSSNNGGYAAPWIIPESSTSNAVKKIQTAILSTQKNAAILKVEEIPGGGIYLAAEADGFLGRDVLEFLVKEDVVTYRSMARKVLYLYPFTTPIGDFDGQQRRLKALEEELGWSIPNFENTYYDSEEDRGNDY